MKRSAVYTAVCAAALGVFVLSSVTALAMTSWEKEGDTVNKITMNSYVEGKIREEYQESVVYPNGTVTKIVKVENTGNVDALPRVKIEKIWGDSRDADGNLNIDPALDPDYIEITYNLVDWIYNPEDGYFYYNHVLQPGEITNSLFDSFKISEEVGGEYKNKLADIIVTMDIIQAGGGGLDYWEAEELEGFTHYVESEQIPLDTTVEFHDPDKGFTFDINEGDLFANFKDLVPGCSRSQIVEITNSWNKEVEITFWADFIDQKHATDETRELIEKLLHTYTTIVITDEAGKVIYNGPVWGSPDVDSEGTDSMKYPYSLGDFDPNQTKKLNVALTLSPDMDNEYQELLGLIKWVFHAEGQDDDPDDTTTPPETDPPAPESTTPPETDPPTPESTPTETDKPAPESTPTETDKPAPESTPTETDKPAPETTVTDNTPDTGTSSDETSAPKPDDKPNGPGNSTSTDYPTNPPTGVPLGVGICTVLAAAALITIPVTYRKAKKYRD
ncbi:MAG: hypothetical protein J1E39_09330 [Eubacterium sp.]|nr:hypothetical protein [Eubacterium sp.]